MTQHHEASKVATTPAEIRTAICDLRAEFGDVEIKIGVDDNYAIHIRGTDVIEDAVLASILVAPVRVSPVF